MLFSPYNRNLISITNSAIKQCKLRKHSCPRRVLGFAAFSGVFQKQPRPEINKNNTPFNHKICNRTPIER